MNSNHTFESEEEFDDTDVESPKVREISFATSKAPLNGSNANRPKWGNTPKRYKSQYRRTSNRTSGLGYDDEAEDQMVKSTKLISDDNQLISPDGRNSLASSPTKIKYTQISFSDATREKEFAIPANSPSRFNSRIDALDLVSDLESPSNKNHRPHGGNITMETSRNADIHHNKINQSQARSSPTVDNNSTHSPVLRKRKHQFDISNTPESKKKLNKLEDSENSGKSIPTNDAFLVESKGTPPTQERQLVSNFLPDDLNVNGNINDAEISRASILEKVNSTLMEINEQAANSPISPIRSPVLPINNTLFHQSRDTDESKRLISDEDLIRKIEAQMSSAKSKPVSNYNYPSKVEFESKHVSKIHATDFDPVPSNKVPGSNNESKTKHNYPVRDSSPLKHQSFPLVESTPKKPIVNATREIPTRRIAISKKQVWLESKNQNLSDEEWTKLYRLLDQFSPDQIANSEWLMDELKCTRHELEQKVQFLLDYKKKSERFTN